VQALAVAAFLFFFGDRASLTTILGANVSLFFFNIAGSKLHRSRVWSVYAYSAHSKSAPISIRDLQCIGARRYNKLATELITIVAVGKSMTTIAPPI